MMVGDFRNNLPSILPELLLQSFGGNLPVVGRKTAIPAKKVCDCRVAPAIHHPEGVRGAYHAVKFGQILKQTRHYFNIP